MNLFCYAHVALAVYSRSPAAYAALKGFGMLQLPSVSSLKHYTGANIEDPGVVDDRLLKCREQYQQHVAEWLPKGRKSRSEKGH